MILCDVFVAIYLYDGGLLSLSGDRLRQRGITKNLEHPSSHSPRVYACVHEKRTAL